MRESWISVGVCSNIWAPLRFLLSQIYNLKSLNSTNSGAFLASLIYAVNSTRASPKPGWERRRVGHGASNPTPWKTPWLKGLHKLHWMTKGNGPRERAYEAAQPNLQGNYHYKLNWSPSAWPGRRWRGQLKTKRWKLPVWTLCSRGNDKE